MSELTREEVFRYFHNLEAEYASYGRMKEMLQQAHESLERHNERMERLAVLEAAIEEAEQDLLALEERKRGLQAEVAAELKRCQEAIEPKKQQLEQQLEAMRRLHEDEKRKKSEEMQQYQAEWETRRAAIQQEEEALLKRKNEHLEAVQALETRRVAAEKAIARLVEKLA